MQKRTAVIEQTKHITDKTSHKPVQQTPNHKSVAASATQAKDATGKTAGGNGVARAPDTGTNKAVAD